MMRHRFVFISLLVVVLLAVLAGPALAQDDRPGKLVVGGSYTLPSGQQISGDLGVLGGSAVIEEGSTVNGDVMVAGGTLKISGQVNGDIAIFGGAVSLAPTARVAGDMVTFGGSVERSPGAVVTGTVGEGDAFDLPGWNGFHIPGIGRADIITQPVPPQQPVDWVLRFIWRVLRMGLFTLALVALAFVVSLLWPRGIERLGGTVIAQPLLTLGVGLLTWILGVALVVILALSICLIPVALLLALALLVAALVAWVVAAWLFGRKLMEVFKVRRATLVAEATLGMLVLAILYFLVTVIPCTAFIAGTLIPSFGMGAIVLTRFGTRPYPYTASTALVPVRPVEDMDPDAQVLLPRDDVR